MSTMTRPTLEEYFATVGNEKYLLARDVLAVTNGTVSRDIAQWVHRTSEGERYESVGLDWTAWAMDYLNEGRGWSSTEHRVAKLVIDLTGPHENAESAELEPLFLITELEWLGSWSNRILAALVGWASGGDLKVTGAR